MKRILIAALLLLTCTNGAPAAEVFAVMGNGAHTCGNFAQSYQQNPQLAESLYFAWAQGYMSGQNAAMVAKSKVAKNLNGSAIEAQQAFLRSHCDQHPLSAYWEAVMTLFIIMPNVRAP